MYNIYLVLTCSFLYQKMYCGGSGLSRTRQVRFMVKPSSRYMSGPPRISVYGSAMITVVAVSRDGGYGYGWAQHEFMYISSE